MKTYEGVDVNPIFFYLRIVGVESKLGPLGTSATYWPIVPAPGDWYSEKTCPDATLSTTNPT
jgi:hypothetical protein